MKPIALAFAALVAIGNVPAALADPSNDATTKPVVLTVYSDYV